MVHSGGLLLAALAVACFNSVSGSIYYYQSTPAPYTPYRYSYYRALGLSARSDPDASMDASMP